METISILLNSNHYMEGKVQKEVKGTENSNTINEREKIEN